MEWVFLAIFTSEMLVKISAYGFICHREAYLHDAWCQLDFLVVTLAWLPILFPTMGNYSVLRAFRALRPLRALKRVPGMPLLVQWILSVLPKMGNVLMLCGFIFLVCAIVGMELFKGALHYRCALPGFEETPGHPVSELRRLQEGVPHWSQSTGMGLRRGLKGLHELVGSEDPQQPFDTGFNCNPEHGEAACEAYPPGTTCSYFDANPNEGLMSFDSVAISFILYFQMTTFDDWANSMYALMEAFSPYVWIYFVCITMLSGFFVVNLFLAVIFMEYGAAQEQIKLDQTARTERRQDEAPHIEEEDLPETTADGGETDGLLVKGDVLSDGMVKVEPARNCDDCSEKGPCRRPFLAAAESAWLSNTSTGLVVVNMVLMCMPYEGMSEEYAANLEAAASIISYIFIVEMAVKLVGLGCAGYWSDGWNCLDGTIVSLSILEIVLTAVLAGMEGVNISFFRILRMLRMLRVLRILRLMKSWKGLYKIIMTFIRAIPHMSNLVVLILLTMFMFSLLGMQLFGGIFNPEAGYSDSVGVYCPAGVCPDGLLEKPHYHFDYCGPAMITVFILLTGEWVDALDPVFAIMGPSVAGFYIFVVILGKYLLMNLLVAVILTEFAEEDDAPATARSTARETNRTGRGEDKGNDDDQGEENMTSPTKTELLQDKSLFLFGPDSEVRIFCKSLIQKPLFDQVVILAIIVSSVCLAIDSPRLDPQSQTANVLRRMDLFFTCLFFCEMSTKIITYGFICNGPGSYLRSSWNQVDFVIVMISLVVLLANSIPQLRPLRVLRVMRVLRPLRLISRNAGMKLIITSLFKTMPSVGNVFGVILSLQLVFAILGMQMFSGEFGSCNNPAITIRAECSPDALSSHKPWLLGEANETRTVAFHNDEDLYGERRSLKGGGAVAWDPSMTLHWTEKPATGSFDNFGDAMRLLYVMSSGDQWEMAMFTMMGAQGEGHAATRNDFSSVALFAIIWMFVGYVFAINLFVGVVVDNFSRMQKAEDGSATMTPEQQQWAETMKASSNMVPIRAMRPPEHWLRAGLFHIINSNLFDGFITMVIILNIGVMACDYWGIEQDEAVFAALNQASLMFGMIYYIECVMKMTALGVTAYFNDNWCRFDFFLVCTSLLDQFAADFLDQVMPLPPMLLRVLRVLRILRILRLLKGAKELRNLIVTMVLSFPSLLNVGSLLALIIFIFAVLGVNLFTFVNQAGGSGGITVDRNFVSFGSSFLLLFQCLTGDAWSSIMADALLSEESGRCSAETGDCGSPAAIPFFIAFQIIGSFIFLNLVVAVILENFEKMSNVNTDLVSVSDLELFSEAWAKYDPDADNYIPVTDVPSLLLDVPKPLGVKGKPRRHAIKMCLLLKMPTKEGEVLFSDVLKAIIENNYIQKGADLAEFKEVAPGVSIPPLAIGETKRGNDSVAVIPLAELFGKQVFEQEHVKELLRNMLKRARDRIDNRGGPEDPATYQQVYVKGGFANKEMQAAAMRAAAARKLGTGNGQALRGLRGFMAMGASANGKRRPSGSASCAPSMPSMTAEAFPSLNARLNVPALIKDLSEAAAQDLEKAKSQKTKNAVDMQDLCSKMDHSDPGLLSTLSEMVDCLEADDVAIRAAEQRVRKVGEMVNAVELMEAADERRFEVEQVSQEIRDKEQRLVAAMVIARNSALEATSALDALRQAGAFTELEAIFAECNLGKLPKSLMRIQVAAPSDEWENDQACAMLTPMLTAEGTSSTPVNLPNRPPVPDSRSAQRVSRPSSKKKSKKKKRSPSRNPGRTVV